MKSSHRLHRLHRKRNSHLCNPCNRAHSRVLGAQAERRLAVGLDRTKSNEFDDGVRAKPTASRRSTKHSRMRPCNLWLKNQVPGARLQLRRDVIYALVCRSSGIDRSPGSHCPSELAWRSLSAPCAQAGACGPGPWLGSSEAAVGSGWTVTSAPGRTSLTICSTRSVTAWASWSGWRPSKVTCRSTK